MIVFSKPVTRPSLILLDVMQYSNIEPVDVTLSELPAKLYIFLKQIYAQTNSHSMHWYYLGDIAADWFILD